MNEDQFRRMLLENGYGEPEFYEADAGPKKEVHAHEHSFMFLVLSGEFTITTEKGSKTYKPGDWGEMLAGTLHAEQPGPEGGSYLAAGK